MAPTEEPELVRATTDKREHTPERPPPTARTALAVLLKPTTRAPAPTHKRGKDPMFMAVGERLASREEIRGRRHHGSRTTLPAIRRASHREAGVGPRSAEPDLGAAVSSRK